MTTVDDIHKRQFEESLQAISSAHWNLTYDQWCKRAGFDSDSYSEIKWQQWQMLAHSLAAFDANTLYRICYGKSA